MLIALSRNPESIQKPASCIIKLMIQLNDFYNEGFGWICRRCDLDLNSEDSTTHSRLLLEGEAESKQPRLSTAALAKWADPAQRILVCPRCGISELVEKS